MVIIIGGAFTFFMVYPMRQATDLGQLVEI